MSWKPTPEEAIRYLDGINTDAETAHMEADGVLLAFVPIEVANAWRECDKRHKGFWYA